MGSTRTQSASPSQDVPTLRMNRAGPLAETPPLDTRTPLPLPPVCGDYELTRVLGRGGMGIVFLARHRGLKREVAYKVLTHVGSLDPDTLDRFRSEAETLGKLQHPGIVQIFDCGSTDGVPFLAMEYVSGGVLEEKLKSGRLPPREAANLIATLAGAVGHAHAHGIIHRDLKPANILLTPDGQPKVADFGLARELSSEHLTRTGMIAGTPTYMPPEQLTGRRDLTPAVDVWALGVLLYQMIAGTVPFAGENPEQILMNILGHDPVPLRGWLPNLSRDLETIGRTCLHKDPLRRYADGQALADDLTRFLAGRPILARPPGAWEKRWRWCRKNPLAAGLTFSLLATLSAATAVSLTFASRANQERANAVAEADRAEDLRQKAEAAAEQANVARVAAETAVAAEKAAHEGARTLADMTNALFDRIEPANDIRQELISLMNATADRLMAGACQPLVRAQLLYQLAETRRKLGHWPAALPLAEMALALRTQHLGPNHPDTHAAAHKLAYCYCHVRGRGADAVRVLKPVVEAQVAALPPDADAVVDLLGSLSIAHYWAGQIEEYERLAERILILVEKRLGPDHPETEWRRVNLFKYSLAAGKFDEGIPVLQKAYKTLEREYGEKFMSFVWLRQHLGLILAAARRHREAIDYLRPAYEYSHRTAGPIHPHTEFARRHLAAAYEVSHMFVEDLPLRQVMLTDATASKSLPDTCEQLLKIARDLMWKWHASVTPPPA